MTMVIAGCASENPSFEYWKVNPYEPVIHLHNIWHEFLPNGTLVAYATVVVPTVSITGFSTSSSLSIVDASGEEIDSSGLYDRPELLEPQEPGQFHEFMFVMEPNEPYTLPNDFYYAYDLGADTHANSVRSGSADFTSGCYRPDGRSMILPPLGRLEGRRSCTPDYAVNWVNSVPLPNSYELRYLHPTDLEFRDLVQDCCGVRSLPAYDAKETFPAGYDGLLAANRSFPVQEGAVNGEVSATMEHPAAADLPSAALSLWVVDASGAEVGRADALPGQPAKVTFDRVPVNGVWHAFFEAKGIPYANVSVEVHVNDGE